MNIIKTNFSWNGSLSKRAATNYIIIHHRAGNGDVNSIHSQHLKNGWTGIGYHFYIRKDGSVYEGRPLDTVGAHTSGKNSVSIGICFEGNYETQNAEMPTSQFNAGQELLAHLTTLYPSCEIKRHRDFQATACPGKYFPFEKILKYQKPYLTSASDITSTLNKLYFKIDDISGFIHSLEKAKSENSPMYWGYYKLVNNIASPQ
ncbi:MAG: hypothetical protein E7415_05995 [Ruminococcaceae bacterium]|nr:hypothetical protein [Oscillospiraceae bacterium]